MDGSWVLQQLRRLDYRYGMKVINDKAWIRCPFHSNNGHLERTPSLVINLDSSLKYKTGTFHCFGCNETGDWNKLAEKLNLEQVSEEEEQFNVGRLTQEDKDALFNSVEKKRDIVSVDWDKNDNWRGISGKLINAIGGQLTCDKWMTDTQLYLPVKVNKKEVGGIYCKIERKSKKERGYINTPGGWIKSRGLFPFDYTKQMLKEMDKKVLFLTEGPRDTLNLLQNGLPSLAILGSNNWSSKKLDILSFLDLDRVVLAFDPDTAGQHAFKSVYKDLKRFVKLSKLEFKQGTDPADLTKKQCNRIKTKLGL